MSRKLKVKRLNMAEHRQRLSSMDGEGRGGAAWLLGLALLALGLGLVWLAKG